MVFFNGQKRNDRRLPSEDVLVNQLTNLPMTLEHLVCLDLTGAKGGEVFAALLTPSESEADAVPVVRECARRVGHLVD